MHREIVICVNKYIAKSVGAGLAPPAKWYFQFATNVIF